jgi:hypothetical protein
MEAGVDDWRPLMPRETIRRVIERHAKRIGSLPGVVGVAEGEMSDGPCITVYVAEKTPEVMCQIPPDVEGWPVLVRESGEFQALGD